MHHFRVFQLLLPVVLGVAAQSAHSRDAAGDQTVPDQRRAELRSVLKSPKGNDAQGRDQVAKTELGSRRLSEQERADLRLQLRPQRGATGAIPP